VDSRAFAALAGKVVAWLTPIPVVTPEEYRQIECNRCGVCCEDIVASEAPEVVAARSLNPLVHADTRRFLSGLQVVGQVGADWRYRCIHFSRDEAGLGACGIHATRPDICRRFPYGKVVRSWRECAWFVEVRDEQGRIVPEVAEHVDTINGHDTGR
jgi:Fe-S-cluster containining protein